MKRKGGSVKSVSGRFVRLRAALFSDVSAESLALFRIAVGAILIWEVYRFLAFGRVRRIWIDPEFNFTYTLFWWLRPLEGDGMVWLFYGLGALALLITIGLFHRAALLLFFVGFSYTFLLEESSYLNHLYLMCLLTFLLVFVPANRRWSLDARLWKLPSRAPAWSLWLIRFQVGVPYL